MMSTLLICPEAVLEKDEITMKPERVDRLEHG